ncbi:hypothetical protein MVEG_06811 [Podila verticillata NRRL 6337]|nr:hypothetical protein MVEG_06811 [Podila verticillata NRRL 6337]
MHFDDLFSRTIIKRAIGRIHCASRSNIHRLPRKIRRSARINTPLLPEQREQAGSLALIKYGHCVRQVEDFAALLTHLEQVNSDCSNKTAHYLGPSAGKLVLHFLKRCPHALLDFEMTHKHIHEIKTFTLALKAMPKVRTLTIRGIYDSKSRIRVSNLKQVLTAASHHLDTLTLATPEVRVTERSNGGGSTSTSVPEPEIIARPKKLELDNFGVIGGHTADWSWLWRTCGQLQQLLVRSISSEITESLIKGVKDSMPCLDFVVFGHSIHTQSWYDICDNRVGAIIAAGTKGWRAVHCGFTAEIGPEAFEALLQHASTLEEFSVVRVQDRTGIIRIFKSCSRLRKLITLDDGDHGSGNFPEVQSADFIDWDPVLKTVRPWPCKTTLETLAIKITDMARWDLLHMPSVT